MIFLNHSKHTGDRMKQLVINILLFVATTAGFAGLVVLFVEYSLPALGYK